MDTMLDSLTENPVPEHIAKSTEGPITKEQIKTAVRKLGNNKRVQVQTACQQNLQTIRRHNYRTTTRSNKRLQGIRMPHGNNEARRHSAYNYIQKRPKRDKELQTNHTTQPWLQNTDNNSCWQTEKHMWGSNIQATEGICLWETNDRPHPPSIPHTRIRRQLWRRCTASTARL